MEKKNIIIHIPSSFTYFSGGTLILFYMAKLLSDKGENVRIIDDGSRKENPLYNNYYDENCGFTQDNTIVIYSEGVEGNPLNAKNIVRWVLCTLGKMYPVEITNTYNKNDLVYIYNNEDNINKENRNIYKLLSPVYLNPIFKNYNRIRKNNCHMFKKCNMHLNGITKIHSDESIEIHTFIEHSTLVNILNECIVFVSYDPLTFMNILAALCGCISIVYPLHNYNKKEWIMNTTCLSDYMMYNNIDNLYGIAYGNSEEEIAYAMNTIHLVEEQWKDICNFYNERHVNNFINDLHNFENMENTVEKFYNC